MSLSSPCWRAGGHPLAYLSRPESLSLSHQDLADDIVRLRSQFVTQSVMQVVRDMDGEKANLRAETSLRFISANKTKSQFLSTESESVARKFELPDCPCGRSDSVAEAHVGLRKPRIVVADLATCCKCKGASVCRTNGT